MATSPESRETKAVVWESRHIRMRGRTHAGTERRRDADPHDPGLSPAWAFTSPRVTQVKVGGPVCTWGHTDGGPCGEEGLRLNCLPTGQDSQGPFLLLSPLHPRGSERGHNPWGSHACTVWGKRWHAETAVR